MQTIGPKFGNKLDGIEYINRPGAYAVIVSHDRQIAVIEADNGYYLPGGGIDPDETPIEALKRELLEETGYQVNVMAELGTALEYIHASREGKYYQIRSSFFLVELGSRTGTGMERDHRLIWISLEQASRLLVRESQVWAILKKRLYFGNLAAGWQPPHPFWGVGNPTPAWS